MQLVLTCKKIAGSTASKNKLIQLKNISQHNEFALNSLTHIFKLTLLILKVKPTKRRKNATNTHVGSLGFMTNVTCRNMKGICFSCLLYAFPYLKNRFKDTKNKRRFISKSAFCLFLS